MKIITCTLNPALDVSTATAEMKSDDKLRCAEPSFEPGGGGVNVSRALKRLETDALAIYTRGGATGQLYESLVKKEGIRQAPVEIGGMTRESLTVRDEKTKKLYRFVLPGPELTREEVKRVLDRIADFKDADYLVASGSLPPGVPDDFYSRLSESARQHHFRLIADTSGSALRSMVKTGAYLIKPNRKELEELLDKPLQNDRELLKAAEDLVSAHALEVVVVSLGPDGAILATEDGSEKLRSPSIDRAESAVGAGDSMVAGIVCSLSQGNSIKEAVKYGLACGSAALLTPGSELLYKQDADRLFQQIR